MGIYPEMLVTKGQGWFGLISAMPETHLVDSAGFRDEDRGYSLESRISLRLFRSAAEVGLADQDARQNTLEHSPSL